MTAWPQSFYSSFWLGSISHRVLWSKDCSWNENYCTAYWLTHFGGLRISLWWVLSISSLLIEMVEKIKAFWMMLSWLLFLLHFSSREVQNPVFNLVISVLIIAPSGVTTTCEGIQLFLLPFCLAFRTSKVQTFSIRGLVEDQVSRKLVLGWDTSSADRPAAEELVICSVL